MKRGIAIGIALGVPIGLSMDIIALGPAIGIALGVAIGSAMEKKHKKELRPLTEDEKKIKNQLIIFLTITALAGVIAFMLFDFGI